MKPLLRHKPREFTLFLFGQKTSLRSKDLLSITAGQVRNLSSGQELVVSVSPKRTRRVVLDESLVEAIRNLLASREYKDSDRLFSP